MARQHRELQFGSDSFLDIIANIVGILIILIVVAGLRAGRIAVVADLPPAPKPEAKKQPAPTPSPAPVVVNETEPPTPPAPQILPPVPQPMPQIDPELQPAIAKLRTRIEKNRKRRKSLQAELQGVQNELQRITAAASQTSPEVDNLSAEIRSQRESAKRLQAALERNKAALARLRRRYDEARRKGKGAKTVRHKLTPVGNKVTGKEIHLRVAGGKVAHVPIDELVQRMRKEVLRRKSWLLKFPTHKGTVGPVGGFTMDYAVQRQMSSVLDELRGGYGRVRIVLSGWKVRPTAELEAEPVETALGPRSRFLTELRAADDGATITFWVYPDSFAAFRDLQQAARREGLRVAARPLPFGIPIAGSPRGSRSSGQ